MSNKLLPPVAPLRGYDNQTLDIQYYLEEDYADVSDAAREIPAVMEWINELRQAYHEERDRLEAELRDAQEKLKTDLAQAEALAYFDLKGNGDGSYQTNYQCKPTEEGLKMAVLLDPKCREIREQSGPTCRKLRDQLATATAMVSRLGGTLDSLQAKVDLIRSSEATRRSTFNDTTPSR